MIETHQDGGSADEMHGIRPFMNTVPYFMVLGDVTPAISLNIARISMDVCVTGA